MTAIRAVFFDVDFTLIHPGPAFQGAGYRDACAAHGIPVDAAAFEHAVATAARTLDSNGGPYDPEVFVDYTCRIIEEMGGTGDRVRAAARDIEAGLRAVGVPASSAVMVGDSLAHDIEGALRLGMGAVLLARAGPREPAPAGVPVIESLRDLPALL